MEMTTLTLPNVDDVVYQQLCDEAERNGRTIEEEHYAILVDVLGNLRKRTREEIDRDLEEWHAAGCPSRVIDLKTALEQMAQYGSRRSRSGLDKA